MSEKLTSKEIAELRQRLADAEETLRAITSGEVDALMVKTGVGEQAFTLQGADTVYRVAIENVNEGVITLSPEGTILFSNHYFAKMMQENMNKVIGNSVFDFVTREDREKLVRLLKQEDGRDELVFLSTNGTVIPVFIALKKLQLDFPTMCAVVTDLSEQKKSEEVLALTNRLAEAQRLSHIGSWEWNIKTGEVSWTDEMYAIFGVDKSDFVPDINSFTRFIYSEDLPSVTKMMGKLLQEGGENSIDFRIIRFDGEVRFLHAEGRIAEFDEAGKPLLIIGSDQDITESKKASEALRQSDERFRTLTASSPVGIGVSSSEGVILFTNPTYDRILGYDSGELIGTKAADLYLNPVDRTSWLDAMKDNGLIRDYELKLKKKNGTAVWVSINTSPISYEGKRAVIGTIQDITERKEMQERLAAQSRLAYLGKMAGTIAHEVRNPLAVIDASAYYLETTLKEANNKTKEHLQRMRTGVIRAVNIIEKLLDMSRMKEPDFKPIDLHRFVADAVLAVGVPAGIEVVMDEAKNKIKIMADEEQLFMAVNNLLKNAIEAMPGGGTLTITLRKKDKWAELSVRDTGQGISRENFSKLFEPLFTTKPGGVGFGLALAKTVVEKHGGKIEAKSEQGKGATFIMHLPIIAEKEQNKFERSHHTGS